MNSNSTHAYQKHLNASWMLMFKNEKTATTYEVMAIVSVVAERCRIKSISKSINIKSPLPPAVTAAGEKVQPRPSAYTSVRYTKQ